MQLKLTCITLQQFYDVYNCCCFRPKMSESQSKSSEPGRRCRLSTAQQPTRSQSGSVDAHHVGVTTPFVTQSEIQGPQHDSDTTPTVRESETKGLQHPSGTTQTVTESETKGPQHVNDTTPIVTQTETQVPQHDDNTSPRVTESGNQDQQHAIDTTLTVTESETKGPQHDCDTSPTVTESGNQDQQHANDTSPRVRESGNQDQLHANDTTSTVTESGNQDQQHANDTTPIVTESGNQDQQHANDPTPTVTESGNQDQQRAIDMTPIVTESGNQDQQRAIDMTPTVPESGNQDQQHAKDTTPTVTPSDTTGPQHESDATWTVTQAGSQDRKHPNTTTGLYVQATVQMLSHLHPNLKYSVEKPDVSGLFDIIKSPLIKHAHLAKHGMMSSPPKFVFGKKDLDMHQFTDADRECGFLVESRQTQAQRRKGTTLPCWSFSQTKLQQFFAALGLLRSYHGGWACLERDTLTEHLEPVVMFMAGLLGDTSHAYIVERLVFGDRQLRPQQSIESLRREMLNAITYLIRNLNDDAMVLTAVFETQNCDLVHVVPTEIQLRSMTTATQHALVWLLCNENYDIKSLT